MKEQNELFKEYKNLQQELGNKREQLSNLYRRKTELEQAKQQSVELTGIYQQIKNFNSQLIASFNYKQIRSLSPCI